jgi:hypothetical protein
LGITLVEREARSLEKIMQGLTVLDEVDALLGIPGKLMSGFYDKMIHAAHAMQRPTMFHARIRTTMEALASYGTSEQYGHRAAKWHGLWRRFSKGTRPGICRSSGR